MLTDGPATPLDDAQEPCAVDDPLRHDGQRLASALEAAGMVAWEWDPLTDEILYAPDPASVLDLPPGPPLRTARDFLGLIHPEDRDRVAQSRERAVQEGSEYCEDFRVTRADGSLAWIADRGRVLHGEGGRPIRVTGILADITARRAAQDALCCNADRERRRADELATLLNSVPAALWLAHDPECRLITVNGGATETFRCAGNPVSSGGNGPPFDGAAATFVVRRDGRRLPPQELPLRRAAASGREVRDELYEIEFGDGTVRHLLGSAVPLTDDDGQPRGALASFVDVSQFQREQQELREAARRKHEFLALLGHELRNPLAAIANGVRLLPGLAALDDTAANVCDLLERQTEHMARLVDDLLDESRIARGMLGLETARLNLADVIRKAAEDIRPPLADAGCTLTLELPEEPLWIDGDPTRLAQILGNLLHNACKFTDAGGQITLTAHGDAASGTAVVTVRDTGVGMSREMLGRLFQPSQHAAASRPLSSGGLGLGLPLVKGLVELHGGTVTAHSDGPGRGSEFRVRFPLVGENVACATYAAAGGGSDESTACFRILLVEDSRPVAEIFAMTLEDMGHAVEVAASGAEALDRLPVCRPEVVFSDISMPGMSGYELARQIRQDAQWQNVLLVAMTGFAQSEDRQRALEAGFDEHVAKPADIDRLREVLALFAERRRGEAGCASSVQAGRPVPETL